MDQVSHSALVVDDDPIVAMSICQILESAGYSTHEASNSIEAKAVLGKHANEITLLFSDVRMTADDDGLALAEHVEQNWPHIEIVIASGRAAPAKDNLPAKASFIGKPFSRSMVLRHLTSVLPHDKRPDELV